MPYKEKDPEKLFYSIGEVAKLFDVNTSLIRFWEKEFTVLKPKKNKKGNRLFTNEDLENLKVIHNLVKIEGYTLDGAKKVMTENKEEVNKRIILRKKLESIKKELENISKDISKL